MKIYFFDFDGTLIRKDSMLLFLFFIEKNYLIFFFKALIFSPVYFLFILGLMRKTKTKETLLKIYFFGKNEIQLKKKSKQFSKSIMKYFYRDAVNYISKIKVKKCIVTASLDIWMKDIANLLDCELICTESKFINGRFYGIKGKNCFGPHKVEKIFKRYDINIYKEIFVFGDSNGDKEMLNLGSKCYYKYFKK